MAPTADPEEVLDFLDNSRWSMCSTYHTVLKSSPGAAIFGLDMLFDIPYVADWKKIGEYRQAQTARNTAHKNAWRVDYNYAVGEKVILRKDGTLHTAEDRYKGPWHNTTV